MLGNSSRGLLPLQKRLLYHSCVIPIATYGFRLWFFAGAPTKAQVLLLAAMQHKAALWILCVFCTSPTGEIKALAGLILIQLHLKKWSCLKIATLPSQHALMSLLSTKHSKGAFSHLQFLAFLNNTQYTCLKGLLLNTEAFLLNFTESFDSLDAKTILDCRLLDNFSDHIFFHYCNRLNLSGCKTYLQSLNYLYLKASSSFFTLVVVTDVSVISSRCIQAVSVTYIWSLGQQILFSKALAGKTTAFDTELFTIRLDIAKATSIDIKCIILITDSLGSARQAVDPSVHPGQAHSLAVCSALRLFFSQGHGYRIDFWDCPSKAEWSLHQLVHNDVTNTRVSAGPHPATSIDFLRSKSVISCLDTWRTSFNRPTIQGRHFLPLRDRNRRFLQPSWGSPRSRSCSHGLEKRTT